MSVFPNCSRRKPPLGKDRLTESCRMFLYGGSKVSQEFTPLYSSWACILILQCMAFTWFTGRSRVHHEVIHSEEDRTWLKNPRPTIISRHPAVEHLRSGHFRNLRLILPYLLITPIWLNSDPPHILARTVLHLFPVFKTIDILFYMNFINGPEVCKEFTFGVCYSVLVYVAVAILILP